MNVQEIEQQALRYYSRRQVFDVARALVLVVVALTAILFYDIQAFSVMVLVVGAIVIGQKENINSIFAYFHILSRYPTGSDVKVKENFGEIARISFLNTTLVGKDGHGAYNGKRVMIPNYEFLMHAVEVQDLKSETLRPIEMRVYFDPREFVCTFKVFLSAVEHVLETRVPLNSPAQAGNYRGFAGVRYVLDFEYEDVETIVVHITFLARPDQGQVYKRMVADVVEGMRDLRTRTEKTEIK
jgi:hypothetical protein